MQSQSSTASQNNKVFGVNSTFINFPDNVSRGLNLTVHLWTCLFKSTTIFQVTLEDEPRQGCPETSVTNYQPTLRNVPEERAPQLHHDGSLKSCVFQICDD